MKRFIIICTAVVLAACTTDRFEERRAELPEMDEIWQFFDTATMTRTERSAMEFLYGSMSVADMAEYSAADYFLPTVRKSIEVRERMEWGIPDDIFRHFVLPPRVNNEAIDRFRILYADSLCARVEGMGLAEAALEINHWCHERVTYKPSDARTSAPLATISTATGRCGEESVLTVAALRAAGIPARQVYTPRWAHTDDNHAWVEVWVDGRWHFMGACEPEPRLDMAWFNAPVSRAMLLHTKVFGDYRGKEDVINRTRTYTEINVIDGYVPTRRTEVRVVDAESHAVAHAKVEFKIYNYAEFYTVARLETDRRGRAALTTGLGDLLVWATDGERFGFAKAESELTTVVLDHRAGDRLSIDFDVTPPAENPIPANATPEEIAQNALRFEAENAMREARAAEIERRIEAEVADPVERRFCLAAKGNWLGIREYFELCRTAPYAVELLNSLSEKDLRDVVNPELFLVGVRPSTDPLYVPYVLCPRIENEMLRSDFRLEDHIAFGSVDEVIEWTKANIRIVDDQNPEGLRMTPAAVWHYRVADSRSRNIFFVAACRAMGFAARIDSVTGKTQYYADGWRDVDFDGANVTIARQGRLSVEYSPTRIVPDPTYYRHFTLAKINDCRADLLDFDEGEATESGTEATWRGMFGRPYELDEGYYLLTSGSRMASGKVLAHMEFFTIEQGRNADIPLLLRTSREDVAVVGNIDAEQSYLPEGSADERSILSTTGRGYFIVAVLGANDEPTLHAVGQLEAVAERLNQWGRPIVVLGRAHPKGLTNVSFGRDVDKKILKMIVEGCNGEPWRLPAVVVADSFGRVVYLSQGYDTSLGEQLIRTLDKL